MSGGIVAVTSLALEARIALGPGVSVICSQGPRLAAHLEAAIKCGASGIISFGIAGGLAPGLAAGQWVAAAAIKTEQQRFPTDRAWTRCLLERLPGAVHADIVGIDAPVADPADKRSLHVRTGAAAVDTESHIAAAIASAHQVPFAACRAIIDAADKRLPPAALVGLRPDGTADIGAVLGSVIQQPTQLPSLIITALDAWIARAALYRGRRMLGAGLGFPRFSDRAADVRGRSIAVSAFSGYSGTTPSPERLRRYFRMRSRAAPLETRAYISLTTSGDRAAAAAGRGLINECGHD